MANRTRVEDDSIILHNNQSNGLDYTCLTIIRNGAKMYLVIFVFLICVIDSIKGFSQCRGYKLCVYVFGWLCRATYCSVVSILMLVVSHVIENKKL